MPAHTKTIYVNHKNTFYLIRINDTRIVRVKDELSDECFDIKCSENTWFNNDKIAGRKEFYTITFDRYVEKYRTMYKIYQRARKPSKEAMKEVKENYPEFFI